MGERKEQACDEDLQCKPRGGEEYPVEVQEINGGDVGEKWIEYNFQQRDP